MDIKMEGEKDLIPSDRIENKILYIRDQKVMIDRDLAGLYGVPTRILNEQVKRNIKRFPDDFMFRLTKEEDNILRSHFAISNEVNSERKANNRSQFATSNRGGRRYLPYAFTEQGVAMLSSVLKSRRAVKVNIAIMRIFVNIRKFISSYEGLAMKIAELEKKYDGKISEIMKVIDKLINKKENNKPEIGFKT